MSWGETPPGPLVLEPQDSPDHPLAAWFQTWRGDRQAARERYLAGLGGRAVRRSRAVVTIVHNEPVFLPVWLGYYSRFFEPSDIYVLDNDTTDGSTGDDSGYVRIPVTRDEVDHTWMVRTIEALQHELLDRYDAVLVTDVDELVSPVPEWGDLGEYIDLLDEEWVNCLGYEILHQPDEPPLDLARPILDQRGSWFPNDGYNKACLATEPVVWRPGFHGREDYGYNIDPDLRMVHLHRMDHGICRERHMTRKRRRWADHDLRFDWASHNRITEEQEFDRWFYEDSCFEYVQINLEPIRRSWRGVF